MATDPRFPASVCDFPRRRWWVRRVDENGSTWLYFFGRRLTLFKYAPRSLGGRVRMLAVYVETKRLNVNWRPYGSLR